MHGGLHELLVLVLTAEVDGGRHGTSKLADARHAAVEGDARAAVRGDAARGDQLPKVGLGVRILEPIERDAVEPPRHDEGLFAVADGILVGARAHEQLQRREQRRLARTRLAREHGQPARRHERGLANQREVLNLDLIDHRAPLTP